MNTEQVTAIAGIITAMGAATAFAAAFGAFRSLSRGEYGKNYHGGDMNELQRRQFELYMRYPLTPTRWERIRGKLPRPFHRRGHRA